MSDGSITAEDANRIASNVQATQPIFSSVKAVKDGDDYDYEYMVQRAADGRVEGVDDESGTTNIAVTAGQQIQYRKQASRGFAWNAALIKRIEGDLVYLEVTSQDARVGQGKAIPTDPLPVSMFTSEMKGKSGRIWMAAPKI